MKQKVNFKTAIGIVVGFLIVLILQQIIFPKLFTPSIDSQLMHYANEINKNCPFMVDSETRLDNAVPGEDKTIYYNYTLINYNKKDINVARLNSTMKPQILNNIKTNPAMKPLRDYGVTFIYNYKDKNSVHITTIKYSPDDYQL